MDLFKKQNIAHIIGSFIIGTAIISFIYLPNPLTAIITYFFTFYLLDVLLKQLVKKKSNNFEKVRLLEAHIDKLSEEKNNLIEQLERKINTLAQYDNILDQLTRKNEQANFSQKSLEIFDKIKDEVSHLFTKLNINVDKEISYIKDINEYIQLQQNYIDEITVKLDSLKKQSKFTIDKMKGEYSTLLTDYETLNHQYHKMEEKVKRLTDMNKILVKEKNHLKDDWEQEYINSVLEIDNNYRQIDRYKALLVKKKNEENQNFKIEYNNYIIQEKNLEIENMIIEEEVGRTFKQEPSTAIIQTCLESIVERTK